ncbi:MULTISPECIES: hypothetical protein [unclassified Herbaspirillum]|uniref:head-tail connector protein n=1 Tax=unclassified Herbaspirillum TaxID=2624150 RepID=UPI000E2E6B4B|nr:MULTISPECIES: hypothetical protein [unclassified Herbaspirillum]RFB73827.1 hypothetical protein DZB54_06015 [Herbaspirillum sp. 3R-3a1]TFI10362.1 hypothetical protein E4P32_02155 [Herbaspirillum sp. 3R11]TFI16266.1 hypothetical protein E4P31_02160 [Herbaspirillum sp. 3R-11]TFI28363.1 hypothetical protein E4P30_08225 [Herbaspirillum sp. 3C11]
MAARLITPPASEPVGVDESRSWAKIDDDVDAGILAVAIQAGREKAEHITGRRLITQTWSVRVQRGQVLSLHDLMPVRSIKTVDGVTVDWEDGLPATVSVDADMELRIECGYGEAKDVPASIKLWIWERLGFLIEHRDALTTNQEFAAPRDYVDGLLDQFIVPRL